MVIKLVPLKNKQSSQIGIPEEPAISLVAFLIPTSNLTGLISPMLASKYYAETLIAALPCHNTRKTNTCRTVLRRLPSYRTRGIL
jgi:hypothetical protein